MSSYKYHKFRFARRRISHKETSRCCHFGARDMNMQGLKHH